jgi:hypothetical protein
MPIKLIKAPFRRALLCLLAGASLPAFAQLNENCVVSVLNRTVQVKPDGTWILPNIPANFGPVRARATCVSNGQTTSGQSALFSLLPNGSVDIPPIVIGPVTPIPTSLTVTAPTSTLTTAGQNVQLSVTGTYANGTSQNLTQGSTGTTYLVSNSQLASISANGLLTAVRSGTVLVQVQHEGAQGLLSFNIALSRDSDGDGILDDVELREGLNPNNPADALDDFDRDGLNNRDEILRGTNLRNPDTDGDTIPDGEEVVLGLDGFITNPLLADTDNDGVPDNVEIASNSDPTNAASVNLAQALQRIVVTPTTFVITINSLQNLGFQQLNVVGEFKLGGTINLTSRQRGTTYTSSNLQICNFGAEDGRVFGAADGTCTITVANAGFSAQVSGTVRGFTPRAISQINIPGYANNVDAAGAYAYVAAGLTGLQVVSVSNPATPQIVGSADTSGNANDVRVIGNRAYVADGPFGLTIFNLTNPATPTFLGAVDTPGEANDVMVFGNRAYIADGPSGLAIINIQNPAAPAILGQVDTPGTARGVDVYLGADGKTYAVVADDSPSPALRVIDVSNPAAPVIVGNLTLNGQPKDLRVSAPLVFLSSFTGGLQIVDVSNPASPLLRGSLPTQIVPRDIEIAGDFAILAEQLFPNAVPVVDITNPANPLLRSTIDFSALGDYAGTGIAVNGPYFYMTGESFIVSTDNGTTGNTRLFIGQYLPQDDRNGVPPTVSLTFPQNGSSIVQGSNLTIRANASDDVAVASVTFFVNGVAIATDTSAPYEAQFQVATNASTLQIQARAIDLGNNAANSLTINVSAIPDPGTTAAGRVIRFGTNAPVSGASVTCLNRTATTNATGLFSIANLPTVQGSIGCSASFVENGKTLRANTQPLAPVVAGVTQFGDLVLREGSRVLLLSDSLNNHVNDLKNYLVAEGNDVTVRPPPEYTWNNTDPPLTGFGCVIHLNGATPYDVFNLATQQALLSFVQSGGGFITTGWSGFEAVNYTASQPFRELGLSGSGSYGSQSGVLVAIAGKENHRIVRGLGTPLTLGGEGRYIESGPILTYANNPVEVIYTESGGNAATNGGVHVRSIGLGRVVKFGITPNWAGFVNTVLSIPNVQKIFANSIRWACNGEN